MNTSNRWLTHALLALLSSTLIGCGSSSSSSGGGISTSTVSGTAATGAAIVGGSVAAKCADNNMYSAAANTSSNGHYTISGIPTTAFPCALEVSYGSPVKTLHSYAQSNGTVNITPLTDMALTLATNQNPSTWFTDFDGTAVTDLETTSATLLSALDAQGFDVPAGVDNPFNDEFSADHTGLDRTLDQLQQSLSNGGKNLQDLIDDIVAGGDASAAFAALTAPASFAISGTASGIANKVHWELWVNNNLYSSGDATNGAVTFSPTDGVFDGSIFQLGITQPANQSCTLVNQSGTLTSDITNVTITCTDTDLPASLPDPTGNGAALADSDGVTGTLNGATYTHTATVNATNSISTANPVGNLAAMTDEHNSWTINNIPAATGIYNCKRDGEETIIQLWVNGTPNGTHATGGDCRIEVTSVTANSIQGRFSALLINAGSPVGTVVDGYFRKSASGGSTATVNAGLAGTYSLTYQQLAIGAPFINGESVSASIIDNTLTVGDLLIDNPVLVDDAPNAIAWIDSASGITYRVFNNTTGVFNEINLFKDGILLGQLSEVDTPSAAEVAFSTLSGSYTPTVTNIDDIYSMSGGTTVDVQVSNSGVVTLKDLSFNPADSSFTFQDRADNAGHFYELNSSTYRLRVFLNTDNAPVYWEVNQKQGSKYLELTEPMPAAVTSFLNAIKATGTQTLTTVVGSPLCSTSDLDVGGNSPNYSIQWAGGALLYNTKTSIYEEGDDYKSLVLNFGSFFRLTQKDSGVLEVETLNKWPLNTAFADPLSATKRATTAVDEIISASCGGAPR